MGWVAFLSVLGFGSFWRLWFCGYAPLTSFTGAARWLDVYGLQTMHTALALECPSNELLKAAQPPDFWPMEDGH